MTVRPIDGEGDDRAVDVAERLADEFSEAAAAATHAGQTELATNLLDRAEVFRLATSREIRERSAGR